jgi:hypothetical protein
MEYTKENIKKERNRINSFKTFGRSEMPYLAALDEIERLQSLTRWIPFDEQRPPVDESRYKAIHKNGKSWWCWVPESPEGMK